ncbi:hypothetical protein LZ24_01581 [Desulfobotulus alkaliphilus]|uniref:Uncharacterized protein n=1 Tax=Desulfobotulus alkaliphilus TaxID=622671 RepID=A0A562RTK7_9BACT|nr:hypothetical protein LZ24_01581 [Desulfobotulus alkaliphilus]
MLQWLCFHGKGLCSVWRGNVYFCFVYAYKILSIFKVNSVYGVRAVGLA